MLTDHYITSQKEIEEVTILICQGTDQILGHLEDHAFYNNGLLFLNEMVTALKGIEACLSINMDQQLIGEIHDLIYCYREIADYFQNKQNGDAEGDSAQLAFKTQEIVEKLRTAVFARKKSIIMLTGNLQAYALRDLMYAIQISKSMPDVFVFVPRSFCLHTEFPKALS